jgi:response regulator RpfG family c-di-GMP phosphodiesterase
MSLKYKHTIMVVDDEAAITKSLQRLFRKENYRILTASSALEGLDLLKNSEKPVSLIISDQRMPEMSGSQFLEQARKIFPNAIRFLLTGYSDMNAVVDAINKGGIHRYLSKPWNDEDLKLQVRQSLEQYELTVENKRLLALTHKQNKELNALNNQLEKKVQERSREILDKNKKLSRLNKELESSLYSTVRSFVSLTEMQAPLLAVHGRNVSHLSREMAQLLDLPENEIAHIEIAALLHDVGKLGFPKKLVDYKETNFSSEEKTLFKRHPEEGQNIVRFIKNLDHVGLMIRSHHERYDGQGYPDHLSGEMIPLGSRIIAVADAYDIIANLKVSAKFYIDEYLREQNVSKDYLSEDELLQQAGLHHLKTFAFTRYDPDIVKEFLKFINNQIPFKNEKEATIDELKAGMVLTRSVYTGRSRFLLPHNTALTDEYIERLKIIHKNDPILETVYVFKDRP